LPDVVDAALASAEAGGPATAGDSAQVALTAAYTDPLMNAISGLLTSMRPFLEADIGTVRSKGIGLAPEPVKLVDPRMQRAAEYNVEGWAIRFAMTTAPALTADVHNQSRMVQFCIPVLRAPGLDTLGGTVATSGELMLRAFILFVNRIVAMEGGSILIPMARTHKAETVEIQGQLWFTKACASDREAVTLIDTSMAKAQSKRVYAYLGGGGLTEASTDLASGVVVKVWSWEMAACVAAATALLSAATPGRTVRLERSFVTTDLEPDQEADERPPTLSAADEFVALCDTVLGLVSNSLGLADTPGGAHHKSTDEAWRVFLQIRHLLAF